jgi:hypothetical protein
VRLAALVRHFIVRDSNGMALAYVYFEDEPGRRAAAELFHRAVARSSRQRPAIIAFALVGRPAVGATCRAVFRR